MTWRWLAALILVLVLVEDSSAQQVPGDRSPRPRWVRLSVSYGPFGPTIQAIVIPPPFDPGSFIPGPPPRTGGDRLDSDQIRPNPPSAPPEQTRPPLRIVPPQNKPLVHDLIPNATVRPPGYSVDMAVDAQTLEEFARAFTAGQQQTMRELYASNRVVEVKAPLRVVRLNQVRELAYVRIATGPFSGKVFVLNARYVIAD